MYTVSPLALALLAAISSVQAVNLHVNDGCIAYKDVNNQQQGLCAPNSNSKVMNPEVTIYGCYDQHSGYSACTLTNYNVDPSYGDVFYGADNCLHDAQGYQLACAVPATDTFINPYS